MKPHEREGLTERAAGDEVQLSSGARLTFIAPPSPPWSNNIAFIFEQLLRIEWKRLLK
jgi:hypothetical protein